MTGEVTTRWYILLLIGGVNKKVLTAFSNGIKTVCLLKENEKDIEDISIGIRNKIELILVSDAEMVLKGALKE